MKVSENHFLNLGRDLFLLRENLPLSFVTLMGLKSEFIVKIV